MKYDIIVAGVGGQGALTAAAVIAESAATAGHFVKQSEVHGMAQKGGTVVSHLRIADHIVASDIVPLGTADLIIGVETLEAVRVLPYLAADGWALVARVREENLNSYPEQEALERELSGAGHLLILDTPDMAREAGSVRAANTVLLGAATVLLPVPIDAISTAIRNRFVSKGERVVDANLKALAAGRRAMGGVTERGDEHGRDRAVRRPGSGGPSRTAPPST